MFTNQQHRQTLSFGTESKLFPKFILETSLEGSPENFRITLPAKPGLNNIINLTLSKSCPVELDQLIYAFGLCGKPLLLCQYVIYKSCFHRCSNDVI